ncbi:MAG TPA: geranylgeranylglyceryl/heptaprenylglyceryl phosphate synthase [Melioribacteraceae bacterium]|nr:geranylgeranylglyceryl/heptaprenylglyceryl phosphate synthase [Melioribacteraceae bacterium]
MKIFNYIQEVYRQKGAAYFLLIDPDKTSGEKLRKLIDVSIKSEVDGFLIGGSLMFGGDLDLCLTDIKKITNKPVIIFPGSVSQVSKFADALLFLSLISGRNAHQLIGEHVLAAPIIKKYGIEPISTGYILVESGGKTTAEYISNSMPIPRNKPEIAASTALAAKYLGMQMVYLEAGSGAINSVPNEMVKIVSSYSEIPLIVGGGIKTPEDAYNKVVSGAKMIVTGNYFEKEENFDLIKEFAKAIHTNQNRTIIT